MTETTTPRRVSAWLQRTTRVRNMFVIALACWFTAGFTFLPTSVRGLFFIIFIWLFAWNLWLERPRRKAKDHG